MLTRSKSTSSIEDIKKDKLVNNWTADFDRSLSSPPSTNVATPSPLVERLMRVTAPNIWNLPNPVEEEKGARAPYNSPLILSAVRHPQGLALPEISLGEIAFSSRAASSPLADPNEIERVDNPMRRLFPGE